METVIIVGPMIKNFKNVTNIYMRGDKMSDSILYIRGEKTVKEHKKKDYRMRGETDEEKIGENSERH